MSWKTTKIEWFTRHFETFDLTSNTDEAISLLRENDYHMIFLDHDLEEQVGYKGAGIDVAYAVTNENLCLNATIIVHSTNDLGADRMIDAMKKTGKCPIRLPFDKMRTAI